MNPALLNRRRDPREVDDPDQTADDRDDHLRFEDEEDDLADPGIPGPSRRNGPDEESSKSWKCFAAVPAFYPRPSPPAIIVTLARQPGIAALVGGGVCSEQLREISRRSLQEAEKPCQISLLTSTSPTGLE
ncbi:uncharacterized protein LOC119597998 [Penaeus monodon]|uniref:uncharacterized protein LOC119597998 n=1 Tax=Penaeus monodon TaxID=6687 RepID=UPI0018A753FF|nr:uncharacterized protein LOC119597998 [Penaeus monodon]